MAELLVRAVSRTHPDAEKDARGAYKRGDIVVVQEDGHVWGKKEGLPRFVIVRIPGVRAERVRAYIASEESVEQFTGQRTVLRRRRWRVRVDDVPAGVRDALRDTGAVSLTWTQIRNYVQDKVTLETAPELALESR